MLFDLLVDYFSVIAKLQNVSCFSDQMLMNCSSYVYKFNLLTPLLLQWWYRSRSGLYDWLWC